MDFCKLQERSVIEENSDAWAFSYSYAYVEGGRTEDSAVEFSSLKATGGKKLQRRPNVVKFRLEDFLDWNFCDAYHSRGFSYDTLRYLPESEMLQTSNKYVAYTAWNIGSAVISWKENATSYRRQNIL